MTMMTIATTMTITMMMTGERRMYPIDDTLSLLVFTLPPSLTIMLNGRLRVERGVWDDDDDVTTTM